MGEVSAKRTAFSLAVQMGCLVMIFTIFLASCSLPDAGSPTPSTRTSDPVVTHPTPSTASGLGVRLLGPPSSPLGPGSRFLVATSPVTVVDGHGATVTTLTGQRVNGLVQVRRGKEDPYVGVYSNDRRIDVYAVHGQQLVFLGAGGSFALDPDGGVWIQSLAASCAVRHWNAQGRPMQTVRVGCGESLKAATRAGLIVHDEARKTDAVLDREKGHVLLRRPSIVGATATRIVGLGADGLELFDRSGKLVGAAALPNTKWGTDDLALVSPDGTSMLFRFGDPACPGPAQCLDLWLLNLQGLRWTHFPLMPTYASLKATSVDWLPDGRVVLAGVFDGVGGAALVWSPPARTVKQASWPVLQDRGQTFVVLTPSSM